MMNVIKIVDSLKSKDIDYFYTHLYDNESDFLLDNDFFNTINDIDIYNRRTVTYIVYQIILNNDLKPSILQKPNGGFSFRDKVNKKIWCFFRYLSCTFGKRNGFIMVC